MQQSTEEMKILLEKLERKLEELEDRYITVPVRGGEVVIKESDIYYIERDKRLTKIHLECRSIETSVKLADMEQRLAGHFFVRCHNSFLVNMKRVFVYEKAGIQMCNRERVPVSRSRYDGVKRAFSVWRVPGKEQKQTRAEEI